MDQDSQPPSMDPPVYAPAAPPPEPTKPPRTIADLRSQIIANGSVIRPRTDGYKSSDDHIELIVAKTPAPRPTPPVDPGGVRVGSGRQTHWGEKDAAVAFNRGRDPMRTAAAAAGESARRRGGSVGGEQGRGEKHYAVLMKRSGSRGTIYVILQGEPRDTLEEALEWMLERTECMMHDLIVRTGRPDPGNTCVVM